MFLTVLGILLQVLEIVRIYAGLYNYGLKNADLSDNTQFSVITYSNGFFLYAESWHFWPWTYAANAIGLIVMITGLIGIITSYRGSYSLLYSFFAFSIFSSLLPAFLIVHYAILLNYYSKYYSNQNPDAEIWNSANRPDSGDISYGIAATNLSLSIITIFISLLAAFLAIVDGMICIRRKPYYKNSPQPAPVYQTPYPYFIPKFYYFLPTPLY